MKTLLLEGRKKKKFPAGEKGWVEGEVKTSLLGGSKNNSLQWEREVGE